MPDNMEQWQITTDTYRNRDGELSTSYCVFSDLEVICCTSNKALACLLSEVPNMYNFLGYIVLGGFYNPKDITMTAHEIFHRIVSCNLFEDFNQAKDAELTQKREDERKHSFPVPRLQSPMQ